MRDLPERTDDRLCCIVGGKHDALAPRDACGNLAPPPPDISLHAFVVFGGAHDDIVWYNVRQSRTQGASTNDCTACQGSYEKTTLCKGLKS